MSYIAVWRGTNTPEGRAQALLRRILGVKEYERYLATGYVRVQGGKTKTWYKIGVDGYTARITGRLLRRPGDYCVHAMGGSTMPATDRVLTLAVMIRSAERTFLKKANRRWV